MEWTEALTKIGPEDVSEALYERARADFNEVQLSELSFAVDVINYGIVQHRLPERPWFR